MGATLPEGVRVAMRDDSSASVNASINLVAATRGGAGGPSRRTEAGRAASALWTSSSDSERNESIGMAILTVAGPHEEDARI